MQNHRPGFNPWVNIAHVNHIIIKRKFIKDKIKPS